MAYPPNEKREANTAERRQQRSPVKSEALRVRLTAKEKEAFSHVADSLQQRPSQVVRRLLREIITGGPEYFDDGLLELRSMHRQLASVGRNLNQLTKLAHKGEALVPSDLIPDLDRLRDEVAQATQFYRNAVERIRRRTTAFVSVED